MRRLLQRKRLDQRGFDHVLLGLAFAVVVAIAGTYYLITTHAGNFNGALKVNMSSTSMCMENMGNSNVANTTVELNTCDSSSAAQHWSLKTVAQPAGAPSGTYYEIIAATSSACVDDYKQRVTAPGQGLSVSNAAFVITWQCNTTDKGQLWRWGGTGDHQLINAGSGGCINDPQSRTVAQTRLIVFSCTQNGGGGTNAQWIETANTSTTNGNGGNTSAPTAPTTAQPGEIQASAGNNMCVTAGSSVTVQTCTNSAAQQWGQVGTASGSSSEQFYNSSTSSFLGVSGTSVVDTKISGNALWTANDNGDGTNTLEQLNGNGNTGMCLDAGTGSGALTLAACAGGTSQSFTLPQPYTAAASTPSSGSGSDSIAFSPSNPSTSPTNDLTALLEALKASGYSFNCNALSVANRPACVKVLGSN